MTLVPPSRRPHTQSHIEVTSCPYPFGSLLANLTLRFFPARSSTSCFLHVTSQILNLPNNPLVLEATTGAGIVYRYVRRYHPHSNFVLPVLLHQTHPVVDPSSSTSILPSRIYWPLRPLTDRFRVSPQAPIPHSFTSPARSLRKQYFHSGASVNSAGSE